MSHDEAERDETESDGGLMIHLDVREWEIAPPFQHLKNAPKAEIETCATIWPAESGHIWTLNTVVALLEKHKQRATYAAVAGVVGLRPRSLLAEQPRSPQFSWIVAKKNGLPSGYHADQMHKDLRKRKK